MIYARQSTAIIVTVGPVLDASGVAVTDGVVGDFKISKNGGAPAALNGSATLTHRNTGHYSLSLTATDVNTVGTVEIVIDDTVNACPMKEIQVVEEATYDVLFAASAPGPASPTNITAGTITTATNVTTVNGLAANVITAASIATGAIDADAIADNAIDAGAIAADAITAAKIATGAIDADALAADAAAEIADAVWDEDATAHQTQGTFGQAIGDPAADTDTIYALANSIKADTAAILSDTGTDGVVVASLAANSITAAVIANGAIDAATFAADVDAEILSYIVDDATRIDASALNTASVTTIPAIVADTNELQTDWVNGGRLDLLLDAVKAKTDSLTFTVAGQVDANAESMNATTILGTGTAGDLWRG